MQAFKTLRTLRNELDRGDYTSLELVKNTLSGLEKNPHNAFITLTPELALSQAKAADLLIQQGKAGPLTGIPIGHKDLFCTQNIRTTCASKMLENFISPYDATVVQRTHQAGMCMVGKLNMDEFAMGATNEYSYFGPVTNPWDSTRFPGGSSGGSAAAVSAGLIPAATGTDTGGSIRQPASLCGITGLKPTYGRISRHGMIAFASSLDTAGPMARSAEDCALMLQALAGFDPNDSTSANRSVPDYSAGLNRSIKGMKIGVLRHFQEKFLDPKIHPIFDAAFEQLKNLGAELVDIDLPSLPLGIEVYYILAPAEASSNLARFDGVRYGYRATPRPGESFDLETLYTRSRQEGFGREVKRRIMLGSFVLSSAGYEVYYLQAQRVRRMIAQEFQTALKDVNAIICPAAPGVASEMGSMANDPTKAYLEDIFTLPVNLAGLPAISLPCGFHQSLPLGLQIIGNAFDESTLLQIAHQYQLSTDWHQRRPQ